MKLLMKRWVGMAVLAMALLAPAGVGTGCATRLESGGAYAPVSVTLSTNATGVVTTNIVATSAADLPLFVADSARNLAYSTLNAAFETEKQNREFLWSVSPEIKHALDRIRPVAKQAVIDYAKARRAYLKNRTPGGLSVLQTVLGRLQQAAAAADAVVPKNLKK